MSLKDACLKLVGKYGSAASTIAKAVLNVVAPGSGTLLTIAEKALDATGKMSESLEEGQWRDELRERLGVQDAELQRLGEVFEFLLGPLSLLCERAQTFADQLEELPDVIAKAIAENPSLSTAFHGIESVKIQLESFQVDLRKIAKNQTEAIPVYERMSGVADYFDELRAANVKPRDFANFILRHREIVVQIERGDTAAADCDINVLRRAIPKSASMPILEAAAAVRDGDYPAAQRALGVAVRLRPSDAQLLEISRRVATKATEDTDENHDDNRPAKPRRLQPGDVLDGWTLEARLGVGGWGQVFTATREGERKAIKVMHAEFAQDPAFVGRFKKEIGILQRLPVHPNLVRIDPDGFGRCDAHGTWYLVMEYIDGPTLETFLASNGPMSEGQVRQFFLGAIEGLSKSHAAGIVHRDIKPSNLILRQSDQQLIFVDFGLAVGVEDFGKTKVGGISILFAAPEQHYGDTATKSSDVFSLCAVIHYALNYDKPSLRKPNTFESEGTPEALRAALSKGLVVNLARRWLDAGALLAAWTSNREREVPDLSAPNVVNEESVKSPSPVSAISTKKHSLSGKEINDKQLKSTIWTETNFLNRVRETAPDYLGIHTAFLDKLKSLGMVEFSGQGKKDATYHVVLPGTTTNILWVYADGRIYYPGNYVPHAIKRGFDMIYAKSRYYTCVS